MTSNNTTTTVYHFMPQDNCKLAIIVAMGLDRAIGERGTMPWYLPDDLKHFKALTEFSCVIMGRRTFESIGRPLPKRRNIVITSSATLKERQDIEVASSFEEAIAKAKDKNLSQEHNQAPLGAENVVSCEYDKIFIIGGAGVFEEGLKCVDELIITQIRASFPCADTHFPDFKQFGYFILQEHKPQLNEYKAFYHCAAEQPSGFAQEIPDFDEEEILVDESDNIKKVDNLHQGLAYSYLTYERIN